MLWHHALKPDRSPARPLAPPDTQAQSPCQRHWPYIEGRTGRRDGPVWLFPIRRVGAAPGSGAVRPMGGAGVQAQPPNGGFYRMCVDATWGQAALLFALAPRQASGAVCQAEAARERRYSRRVRFIYRCYSIMPNSRTGARPGPHRLQRGEIAMPKALALH